MLSFSYQRNGFIAFDILLLELIRWLIIINTIFFCCGLHLTEHLLLYAHVSFKLRAVFWLTPLSRENESKFFYNMLIDLFGSFQI